MTSQINFELRFNSIMMIPLQHTTQTIETSNSLVISVRWHLLIKRLVYAVKLFSKIVIDHSLVFMNLITFLESSKSPTLFKLLGTMSNIPWS